MSEPDPDELRGGMRQSWERAAPAWGERADSVRRMGLPVSRWMIEHAAVRFGERVLELAAGAGDTGFLAASLGGRLICSDGAEAMVEVARERARTLGVENVEFRQLELEWIDLPAAEVDVILCRWGLMLIVDPEAGLRECRRVLRPGGRIALAVWDQPAANPWATIPARALAELGHPPSPPNPSPGMFALASPDQLRDLLQAGGFLDVEVDAVTVQRRYPSVTSYLEETLDLSMMFRDAWPSLPEPLREAVPAKLAEVAAPWLDSDGALCLPGRSLVAAAQA